MSQSNELSRRDFALKAMGLGTTGLLYAVAEASLLGAESTPNRTRIACVPMDPLGTIGIMICKDGGYPEVPRVLAVKGAEIILWMTNRGGVDRRASAHYASSNRTALLVSNRAKGHAAGGGSAIFDSGGSIVSQAGQEESIINLC